MSLQFSLFPLKESIDEQLLCCILGFQQFLNVLLDAEEICVGIFKCAVVTSNPLVGRFSPCTGSFQSSLGCRVHAAINCDKHGLSGGGTQCKPTRLWLSSSFTPLLSGDNGDISKEMMYSKV